VREAVLLTVEHDEGVAGVYREDGFHWLSGSLEHGGTRMTAQRFCFEGLREAWVYGGFVPADAERVLARDAHGTWSEASKSRGPERRSYAAAASERLRHATANASTTAGSNCVPAWRSSSSSAASGERAEE
jgi:hypothetical protein